MFSWQSQQGRAVWLCISADQFIQSALPEEVRGPCWVCAAHDTGSNLVPGGWRHSMCSHWHPHSLSVFSWIKTSMVMWEADSSGIFSMSLLDHIKLDCIKLDHMKPNVRWAVECGGVYFYLSDKWPCLSECSDYIAVLADFQKQLWLLLWTVVSLWHLPSLKVTQGKGGEIVGDISLFSPVFPGEFHGEFPGHRCFLFMRTFCFLNCSYDFLNNEKFPLDLEVLRHY